MRKTAVVVAAGAVLVAGLFAANSLGGSDQKIATGSGPSVEKEVKRVDASQARASGAPALPKAKAKQVKLKYFTATTPTVVPANSATVISVLSCPAGRAISGFYLTDRAIAVDFFSASESTTAWEFGFFDLSGLEGAALEGIVCAKGVK